MITPWVRGPVKLEAMGLSASAARGTSITADGTNPTTTPGAWVELIAATTDDYHGVTIHCMGNTTRGNATVQFGIGGVGVEQVVIPEFPSQCGSANGRMPVLATYVPIYIPKGSRVISRVFRGDVISTGAYVMLTGHTFSAGNAPYPTFHRITSYGALNNYQGTTVDAGGSANTLGAITSIVSGTSYSMNALMLWCTRRDSPVFTGAPYSAITLYAAQPSSPSAGTVIPEHQVWQGDPTGDFAMPCSPVLWPVDFPSGTILSAAARCSVNTVGERESQVVIWGFD